MYQIIKELAEKYHGETINNRRDFHQYAERGWLELRTASIIARKLEKLGYEVLAGKEVMKADARMGLPPQKILDLTYIRAVKQGADEEYVEKVRDGFTGVVNGLEMIVGECLTVFTDMRPSGKVIASDGRVYEAALKFGGYASKGEKLKVVSSEQGRLYCDKL